MTRSPSLDQQLRILGVIALAIAAGACNRSEAPPAQQSPPPAAAAAPEPPAQPPAPPPAPPPSFSPAQLDELLAPIALYPDTLLAQVLAASTNAQEVLDAGNWLLENQALKGDDLTAAASQNGFGPSVQALVHFPTVVDMMCQEIDWTTRLGDAFSGDQSAVLASVQRLRAQAFAAGNLASTPEQKVEKAEVQAEGGTVKEVITVEPAQPQVVYVPQYNPQQVYAAPAPAATTTTTSSDSGISTGEAVMGGLLAFGLGVMVGNSFDDDNDCCYPNWGGGGVYYGGGNRYVKNNIIYAPRYGNDFRRATAYNRPGNYPYAYDRASRPGNSRQNLNRNQSGYFDRYRGGAPRAEARATPAAGPRTPRAGAAQPRPTGGYAGNKAAGRRDWNGAGTRADLGRPGGGTPGRAGLPSAAPAGPKAAGKKPAASRTSAGREKAGAGPSPAARPSQPGRTQYGGLSGDRQGSFDNAASSRGRASVASQERMRGSQSGMRSSGGMRSGGGGGFGGGGRAGGGGRGGGGRRR